MYITTLKKGDVIFIGDNVKVIIGRMNDNRVRLMLDVPKNVKITKNISESGKMNYHCYQCSHEFYLEEGEIKKCPQCGGVDLEPFED